MKKLRRCQPMYVHRVLTDRGNCAAYSVSCVCVYVTVVCYG